MPAPSSPSWTSGNRRHVRYGGSDLRASDAERTEVADRLSVHYGDGRLDQEEFDRRLHQAMSAVTQADLNGLFADLPDADPKASPASAPPPQPTGAPAGQSASELARRPPRRLASRAIALLLILLVAGAVSHTVAHLFPWLVIAAVAMLVLSYRARRRS